jgi:adenosylcobinamide kinase/adenosylcobinamide-phosphate guanylyltransferase
MITMITGGARSGKSRYAAARALALADKPLHIATARIWDEEFRERVERHRSERTLAWENLEEEKYVSRLPLENRVCVIDCVTLWLTNFFTDTGGDILQALDAFEKEILGLKATEADLFIVTNEIGMGIHADSAAGRKFTDLQGWANQYLAGQADSVILMVSGIPLTVK